jgi:glycosyltransferase involved in cell wall biosynthesis
MASGARPPHVLYVAWGFPPCRGGGVYRALATANGFAEAGMRVTVLTADRETFTRYTGADESLEQRVDPRVRVERVPFAWPMIETDIRRWSPARALTPRLWRKVRVKADLIHFPEAGYGPWAPALEQAALEIHRRDPVDLVVASANPNVDFVAADVLHRQAGVPYVMDYRDAWMLNVFDGDLLHHEGSRVARLERRLVQGAREIWFVNEPIRTWHQARYPDSAGRMHVVANGFDPEFAPTPQLEAPPPQRPLRFGYIGTLSTKVPLAEFAEGWREAVESGDPDLAQAAAELHGYLGFYATPNAHMLRTIGEAADVGLSYQGPVAKAQVSAIYESFDVLLLILGAGLYVTSGKVFEYVASALPIVSVHDPRNAASDVLQGYPLWFPIADLEPHTIATALRDAAHAARTASPQVRRECWEFGRRYARDLQLQPRIAALGAGLGHRTAAETTESAS